MGKFDIDIASLSSTKKDVINNHKLNEFYRNYDEALKSTKSNLVYVSVINSLHSELVLKSLSLGKHVIVDKPAFLTLKTAEKMVDLAKKKHLLLAEATVFCYHAAFKKITELSKHMKISNIMASFSFSGLEQDNYRLSRELGGGALADIGPYASAIGRVIFKSKPLKVICKILEKNDNTELDVSFSLMAFYSHGRSFLGYFGFHSEYQNYIKCSGPEISIYLNRFASLPSDTDAKVKVSHQGEENQYLIQSDSFKIFFMSINQAIENSDFESFYSDIIEDAIFRNSMEVSTLK
jgi:predicted dehydrogenase